MASTTLTPEQRRIRARVAAYALHAQGGTNTGPALAARLRRLEDRVDPDRTLPSEERARRANLLLRSQMAALALKASRARTKKKAAPAIVSPGAAEEIDGGDRRLPPAA